MNELQAEDILNCLPPPPKKKIPLSQAPAYSLQKRRSPQWEVNSFKCQSCLYSLWDRKYCRQRILQTLLPALPAKNNPAIKDSYSAERFLVKSELSESSKFYLIYFSISVGPFFFLLGLSDNLTGPWARLVRGYWALYKSTVVIIITVIINIMHISFITLSQKKEPNLILHVLYCYLN